MRIIAKGLRLRFHYTPTQTDLTNRISLIRSPKVSECTHSAAASVLPCDKTKAKKVGTKVRKDERRAMVESYKAVNNGKFPSPSDTRRQVGGSYYTIRVILQEMEHRSKAPPINTGHENVLTKELTDVNVASTDFAAVPISRSNRKTLSEKVFKQKKIIDGGDFNSAYSDINSIVADGEPKSSSVLGTTLSDEVVKPTKTVDVFDHGLLSINVEEGPKASTFSMKTSDEEVVKLKTTSDSSCYIEKQKHEREVKAVEVSVHLHSEKGKHDVKEILPSGSPNPQGQQLKPFPESDKFAMGISEKRAEEEELPKQQSMWRNLKSLADGFMKIWKGL